MQHSHSIVIVMEYASGGTLQKQISDKKLTEAEAHPIMVQILQGV